MKILSKKKVFSTAWFDILETELDRYDSPYYIIDTDDFVSVLTITEAGEYLLIEQYRPALNKKMLELVAGYIEKGETPVEAAYREVLEETGHKVKTLEKIGKLTPNSGRMRTYQHCFVAIVEANDKFQIEEGITLKKCNQDEFLNYIKSGEMIHSIDMGTILLWNLGHFDKIKKYESHYIN